MEPKVIYRKDIPLVEFLEERDFIVDKIKPNLLKVNKNQVDVFVNIDEDNLFFQVDLGDVSEYASQELYETLLDLNTEILPVSLGLDTTTNGEKRLIIVESRETTNLDENEVMSVFEAMYIGYVKVSQKLENFIK